MENQTIPLSSPIATGRTAEVYAWPDGRIVKLFYAWFSPDAVEREYQISQVVAASGLPVAQVGEIVQINGRNGLVFERVNGIVMGNAILQKPWLGRHYVRRMAELHARIHSAGIDAELPAQRARLIDKINHVRALNPGLREKVLAALDHMPDGEQLCHNDFHPENILVNAGGEVVIDWVDANRGNPLADVARTSIILLGEAECGKNTSIALKTFIRWMHRVYLHRYFALRPGGADEYQRWLPIMAAARLSESIPELTEWLLVQAEKV